MKKKTLFFIALLLAPIMSLHVWGKTSPQVIWCEGNTTLYFLHSETSYYEGDTYDGQIVTNSWKGESKVLRQDKEWDVPDWASEDDYPTIQKNCTRVVFDSSFAFVRPYSTFKWFSSFTKLASIEGIEYLNTSRVTVMNSMFYNCKSLTSIFLDFFDVTRVVNATGMFTSCEKLRYIYCENTWNIEQTTGMFVYCNNLPRYSWTSPTDGSMANPTTGFFTKPTTAIFKGSGTENFPYLIESVNDLNHLAAKVNMGKTYSGTFFEMTQDIVIDKSTNSSYAPIGCLDSQNNFHYFCGVFNGQGHSISNIDNELFDTDISCSFLGIFGLLGEGGVVKNMTLKDSYFVGYKYVGGIVGYNMKGTIENCHVTDDVTIHGCREDALAHGGIVGENNHGTIVGCTCGADVSVNVYDFEFFGGIAGFNDGTLRNCLYYGEDVAVSNIDVTSVGAIVGTNDTDGNIENCLYTSDYRNFELVGMNNGTIIHSGRGYTVTLNDGIVLTSNITTTYPSFDIMSVLTIFQGGAIIYNDICYAMLDDVLSFGFDNVPNGYTPIFVATDELDNEIISDNNGQITMPESNITVDVKFGVAEWTGNGTEENPYIIYTPGQLDLLASRVNANRDTHYEGKYFILANDLEYDGTENNYTPVGLGGGIANYFGGTFDGKGHTISGININGTSGRQALFSVLRGATVKNLTLSYSTISGDGMIVGGIAGYTLMGTTIENCHVADDVTISAPGRVGGIVGHCYTGDTYIYGCSSAATVKGSTEPAVGGIAGYAGWSTTGLGSQIRVFIENCLYKGKSVEGNSYVGAIVGRMNTGNYSTISLTNNYYITKGLFGCGNANNGADMTNDNGAVRGYAHTEKPEDIGNVVTVYGEGTDAEGITAYENGLGYKGLYYTTDNPFLKYDINHDGYFNISDVVALIDIVLGKDNNEPYQYDHQAADVNGSGDVNIADAASLVTIILDMNEE